MLNNGEVLCHPFVIGEVACGHLQNRGEVLNLLKALPEVRIAEHSEDLHLVNMDKLYGRGLGGFASSRFSLTYSMLPLDS